MRCEIRHSHTVPVACQGNAAYATWDIAVNVGTSDADDLLRFKLVYNFRYPIIQALADRIAGFASGVPATIPFDTPVHKL
jgi:hypothetical protein